MTRPKVSILVPTYNAVPFLEQALDSLVAQTLTDIEIIVINDGSTDRSPEIIADYAARDSRFVVINKRNSGYGATMNLGLDRAKGAYIGILEPDDYASPLMFQRLYEAAAKHSAEVAKANYNAIRTDAGVSVQKVNLFRGMTARVGTPFRPLDDERLFRIRPSIWSGIYRTDFLRRHGIRFLESPGASYQDAGFSFKVWSSATRVVLLDEPYLYYRTDNATSSVKDPGKVWAVADEYASIQEFVGNSPRADELLPILQGARFEAFRWNLERLAPQLRSEFFEHVLDEFQTASRLGQLHPRYFNRNNWTALQQLLSTPQVLRDADHLLRPAADAPPAAADKIGRPRNSTLISVIIPVFNAERYLKECLDTVLAQTHTDIEVLCIDDGSTDLSPDILAVYAAQDARVRVVTQPNAGAGVARNTGIDLAEGAYLSFLDADDVFEATMLERAFAECELHNADFCVYQADAFSDGAPTKRSPIAHGIRRPLLPSSQVFTADDIRKDAFSLFQGWAWDKLYRADFVRANGLRFQSLRTTNDLRFVLTSLACAERIITLPETLVHQRRQVLTSLSRTRERSWDNFYHALVGLKGELTARGLFDRFRKDFANYALQLTLWNLNTLEGASFHRLYDALKAGWLDEFDITHNGPKYFYNASHFIALQRILTLTSHEYRHQVIGDGPVDAQTIDAAAHRTAAPDLSVIVPVYNTAEFLPLCLDSVLSFEGLNVEIVCVNDGSTDSSAEILERYRALDARIVVVTQDNGGLSAARNTGLSVARGTYVCFLDSDDYYRPVDLPGLVRRALDDDLDLLGFDAQSFREPGVTKKQWTTYNGYYSRSDIHGAVVDGPRLLANMRGNGEYRVSCCLYLVRREFLREEGIEFIPGIAHEDNAFTFAVMVRARRASHEPIALYGRRVRPGSIMTDGSYAQSARGYLAAIADMLQTVAHWRGEAEVAAHLGGLIFQALHNARRQYAEVPTSQRAAMLEGLEEDPTHHFLTLTTARLKER